MKPIIGLTLVGVLSLGAAGLVLSSEGDEGEHERREGRASGMAGLPLTRLDVAPATDPQYLAECGSCHFAYQPGLLPERSWRALMGNLAEHFGENAELDPATTAALTDYLAQNAAETSRYRRSKAIVKSIAAGDTPLRITDTRYFQRKHDELPPRWVADNPEVQSFSRCEVCHTQANTGSYDEHQVQVPGLGRWED